MALLSTTSFSNTELERKKYLFTTNFLLVGIKQSVSQSAAGKRLWLCRSISFPPPPVSHFFSSSSSLQCIIILCHYLKAPITKFSSSSSSLSHLALWLVVVCFLVQAWQLNNDKSRAAAARLNQLISWPAEKIGGNKSTNKQTDWLT